MRVVSSVLALFVTLAAAPAAQAVSIHDEAVNGDLSGSGARLGLALAGVPFARRCC